MRDAEIPDYVCETCVSRFLPDEKEVTTTAVNEGEAPALCEAIIPAGAALLDGVGARHLSRELLDDHT